MITLVPDRITTVMWGDGGTVEVTTFNVPLLVNSLVSHASPLPGLAGSRVVNAPA